MPKNFPWNNENTRTLCFCTNVACRKTTKHEIGEDGVLKCLGCGSIKTVVKRKKLDDRLDNSNFQ